MPTEFEIAEILKAKLWANASKQYNGGGLEDGIPDLTPARQVHKQLTRAGEIGKAQALKCLVLNKAWCGHRISQSLVEGATSADYTVQHQRTAIPRKEFRQGEPTRAEVGHREHLPGPPSGEPQSEPPHMPSDDHVIATIGTCKRCNTNSDDNPYHRFYGCPANKHIDDPVI